MFTRNPDSRNDNGNPQIDAREMRNGASGGVSSPPVENVTRTTISADLKIEGNVVSKGEVQVDGDISGSIRCAALVVGQNSEIMGDVIAEEIVVRGRVLGSVYGRRVLLQSTAYVEGDVHHEAIGIESGAHFEGNCRRMSDPVATITGQRQMQAGDMPKH